MQDIQIYRDGLPIYAIKPKSDSSQNKRIMGENELRLNFVDNQFIQFKVGDWTDLFNERYYLVVLPTIEKHSSREYHYTCVLKSTSEILKRVQFLFLGNDNSLKEGEFSITGTGQDFLNAIVQNCQRLAPTFNFKGGQVDVTDYKTISFKTTNCYDALAQIAQSFETEYWVEGETIHLTKIARDTGYQFRQGLKKGLYELVRKTIDNSQLITRLYAFGSDKNLPENYRTLSKRLKIPSAARKTPTNITWSINDNGDGTKAYSFSWDPPEIIDAVSVSILYRPASSSDSFSVLSTGSIAGPITVDLPKPGETEPSGGYQFVFRVNTPSSPISSPTGEYDTAPFIANNTVVQPAIPFAGEVIFIEKNISKYGLCEGTMIIEDIYPKRTGTVTGVNAGNEFEITDTSIDFDINDYLLPGMTAKITFNTGQLSGYTFDISSYNHSFKRIFFLINKNERSIEIPNFLLRPAIGDKYVLTDIKMPQTYIDAAEQALLARATMELDLLCEPQFSYTLTLDPLYVRDKKYDLKLGDLVWIIDDEFQVNRKFRIVNMQRGIINQFEYSIELADTLRESPIQALTTGQNALSSNVNSLNGAFQNAAILNNRVIGDLIVTSQGAIKFENLATGTGLTAIGVDSEGRVFKL